MTQTKAEIEARLRELEEAEHALMVEEKIEAARHNLRDFIELMFPDPEDTENLLKTSYDVQKHHEFLIEACERIERREVMQFANSIPPQHGKSAILSKCFIAWAIGRNPHWHIIVGTYSGAFAENDIGATVREYMQRPLYQRIFPKAVLRSDSKSKANQKTTANGSLTFAGRKTATTGKSCDLFVIDDPMKDANEARSETIREEVWSWYNAVVSSRVRITTPVAIFHTRWSHDDLIARLTDKGHPLNKDDPEKEALCDEWEYINLPAIIDTQEVAKILGKKVGDALWPERFPIKLLERSRKRDPLTFSALYMGQPSPETGSFFQAEDIKLYHLESELPKGLQIYAAGDFALTTKARNDATAIVIFGIDSKKNIWVLDAIHERIAVDHLPDRLLDFLNKWKPLYFWSEKGKIDIFLKSILRQRMQDRDMWFNFVSKPATTDKQHRAQPIQAMLGLGKVYFPAKALWWPNARSEMLKFPDGAHDDFVDALAWGGIGISEMMGGSDANENEEDKKPEGSLAAMIRTSREAAKALMRAKAVGNF